MTASLDRPFSIFDSSILPRPSVCYTWEVNEFVTDSGSYPQWASVHKNIDKHKQFSSQMLLINECRNCICNHFKSFCLRTAAPPEECMLPTHEQIARTKNYVTHCFFGVFRILFGSDSWGTPYFCDEPLLNIFGCTYSGLHYCDACRIRTTSDITKPHSSE